VSEKGALRRICRPKREEVAGDWRRLHNGELHKLYATGNSIKLIKSRRMRWTDQVAVMEEKNAYITSVGKPEGKIPVRRPSHRWKVNI
jgi:hypothetical protein